MSRVVELIRELCPEGITFRPLGELVTNRDNERKPVSKGLRVAGQYPYYGANGVQDYVSTYIFDGTFLLVGEDGSVCNTDGTPILNWASGKIWVNNHAHVLQEKDSGPLLRYLYFYLSCLDVTPFITGGTQKKINQANLNRIPVAIPPIEIQKEIVSILDKFTQLEAELEAELEARRTQYEVTRDRLLDFSGDLSAHPMGEKIRELCPEGVVFTKLGEFGKIYTGLSGKTKADFSDGNSPFVSYSDIGNNASLPQVISSRVKIKAGEKQNSIRLGDLLFTGSSEDRVGIGLTSEVQYEPEVPTYVNSFCFGFRPLEGLFSTGFLKHCLRSSSLRKSIMACSNGVTRINISKKNLLEILVPQPPLEAQREIVDILDKLDALVNDISQGLPAEIVTRRKQYEYYRNKLLTFKEMDAA